MILCSNQEKRRLKKMNDEEIWRQHVPKKIQRFIDAIPENGAVQVCVGSWDTVTSRKKKAIGKIDGRLEFFEFDDDAGAWDTVYIWHYQLEPEQWEHSFDAESMPRRTGKVYHSVFV
jgi:hypothetical protein